MQTDWQRVRAVVYERDGHVCMKCGKYIRKDNYHVDHIRPISKGGAEYSLENLQLLCQSCNLTKQGKWTRKDGGVSEKEFQESEVLKKQRLRRKS